MRFSHASWAPRGKTKDVIVKLNAAAVGASADGETNAALADPRIKARLAEFGGTILAGSPADFGSLIATECAAAHIKVGHCRTRGD